jgi:hypothetical protein
MRPHHVALMLVAGMACVLGACGEPTSLAAPTGASAGPASARIRKVSGYVLDSAFRPLPGVRIEIPQQAQDGSFTVSNESGGFVLQGNFDSTNTARATKDGYSPETLPIDTGANLFFHLSPSSGSANIAGNYTLSVIADAACTDLPSNVRARQYDASVSPGTLPSTFTLTASGSTFVNGLNTVTIGVAGDSVSLWLHGGHDAAFVEQLDAMSYFAISGVATGSVGASRREAITTAFDGWIDYCASTAPLAAIANCQATNIRAYNRCESSSHRIVLTPR